MKLFIRNSVFFLFTTVFIYISFIGILVFIDSSKYFHILNISYRPASYGHLKTRLKEIRDFKNVDILVIGSSHAYRGFDPRIFNEHGFSMYNLGSSSQSPKVSYFLLKEYLEVIKPQRVIFEVYPKMYTNDGVESALDVISNDRMSPELLGFALSFNNISVINTYFYRIFDDVVFNRQYLEPVQRGKDTYVKGGFVMTNEGFRGSVIIPRDTFFSFKDYQFEYLKKAADLLNKRGIPFILVQAPVSNQLASSVATPNEFKRMMEKIGEYKSYQFKLNLNDSLDFVDANHLSQKGVECFNRVLIKDILLK